MKRWINALLIGLSSGFLTVHAAAIMDIVPSSSSPIAIPQNGQTYLTYTVKNNTSKIINALSIDPNFGNANGMFYVNNNQCGLLTPGASCSFTVTIRGQNQPAYTALAPRVCAYNGTACSIPVLSNRVLIIAGPNMPNTTFPTPYAGTFYPIYNSGPGQWIAPDSSMPFQRVSAIFVAFAHAYPSGNGAIFTYEAGQPNEPVRLAQLSQVARGVNPSIKILISLGWGKNDWTYINNDYINHANLFVPSVIQFIRANNLDGIDIDDEEIGASTGVISQANFDGVIANLRNALNYASLQDGKPYYLTITPAGNNPQPGGIDHTQIDSQNVSSFNLINIQSYFNEFFGNDFIKSLRIIGYPSAKIANGITTEECDPDFPPHLGFAGLFNWNMSADSVCSNFQYTKELADLVGYYG
ncbi:glycosyl hydrolase family 18 protein [Legionella fairfieldensis]|uniref:glycosyl hydrolase family 18 protein n=1 Tax=Legionella fairfieldensis TaxID=45064 RepID=UPI000684CCB3|nr:glycosyl hydrolase family 18 protein [Legionella fairfieldensis]